MNIHRNVFVTRAETHTNVTHGTFIQHVAWLMALHVADVDSCVDVLVWRTDLKHHAGLWSRTAIRQLNAV